MGLLNHDSHGETVKGWDEMRQPFEEAHRSGVDGKNDIPLYEWGGDTGGWYEGWEGYGG